MSTEPVPPLPPPLTLQIPQFPRWQKFVLAAFCLLVSVLGFVFFSPNFKSFGVFIHLIPLGPAVIFLAAAYHQKLTPSSITLDESGLTTPGASGPTTLPWSQLAWFDILPRFLSVTSYIHLYDTQGRTVFIIPANVADADSFLQNLSRYITQKSNLAATQTVIQGKNRTYAFKCFVLGSLMTAVGLFLALTALRDMRREKALASHGIPGNATITERFLALNDTTTRLKLQIQGQNGLIGTSNIEVSPAYWETLAVGDSFPVRYDPADPDNNQPLDLDALLRQANAKSQRSPFAGIVGGSAACLFGVLTLVSGLRTFFEQAPQLTPSPPPDPA